MNSLFAMLNGWEIVMILAVVLILFGAKRLPELAKGLGQGIREFKKSSREVTEDLHAAMEAEPPAPAPKPRQLPPETQARIEQQSAPATGTNTDAAGTPGKQA